MLRVSGPVRSESNASASRLTVEVLVPLTVSDHLDLLGSSTNSRSNSDSNSDSNSRSDSCNSVSRRFSRFL
jgi:hypothetical protein